MPTRGAARADVVRRSIMSHEVASMSPMFRTSARAGNSSPNRSAGQTGKRPPTMPSRTAWIWFVVILIVNFLLARMLLPGAVGPTTVPYTLFKDEVGKGNVRAIYSRGDTITGRFKTP